MGNVLKLRQEGPVPADDATLVARAAEGADWAQGELFQRHGQRVLGLMIRLLGSTADAEDATQDTFIEAFRDLPGLREPGDFGRWVGRIAVHQAHRRFRRRRLLRMVGFGAPGLDATLDKLADERVSPERRAELGLVQKTLDALAADVRLAWMLRVVEGYELTEVATAMDVSLATVKRKVSQAQAAVDAATGRAGGEP